MLKRVITYGSYDMLHYGHRRLLERAKALGDYLIVGVTSDDYDKVRGKVNLQQNLYERISAVEALGIADQIIVEEYDGQKIDDIQRYNIDIFAIGSDWTGKFDYLKEYCQVVYLERTPGISSTEIRSKQRHIRLGLIGDTNVVEKYWDETQKVNGVEVSSVYTDNPRMQQRAREEHISISDTIDGLLDQSDAIYLRTFPEKHFDIINNALIHGKHVLCECPVVHRVEQWEKLNQLALQHKLVLWGGLKTAYSTAFNRLILLVKTGIIGQVTAIDATASSLRKHSNLVQTSDSPWGAFDAWGPSVLLPVFQLLGTSYTMSDITVGIQSNNSREDVFGQIKFTYPTAIANVKIGSSVKSEGSLVISGTTGYIYVPSPWWKTDYFEVRRENPADNRRYFYTLEGEGIRNELVAFVRTIEQNHLPTRLSSDMIAGMIKLAEQINRRESVNIITIGR